MADLAPERPCIHVCVVAGAEAALYGWVEIGAEEEGLPTHNIAVAEHDVVAAAYAAAQSSRFDIGVAIAPNRVVLHEVHMPPSQPVLSFELGAERGRLCRLMGGNAARMVVRLPLRVAVEAEAQHEAARPPRSTAKAGKFTGQRKLNRPSTSDVGEIEVKRIARIVAERLRERGVR
jgi:hypothetical protein